MHTTNYKNTLITVATDCAAKKGEIPPVRGAKMSIANHEYQILINSAYQYTSDDVKFLTHARRNEIPKKEYGQQREIYFSTGQPCFRASPLTKRYGWGVHANAEGKIALLASDSTEYTRLVASKAVVKVNAMRSKKN